MKTPRIPGSIGGSCSFCESLADPARVCCGVIANLNRRLVQDRRGSADSHQTNYRADLDVCVRWRCCRHRLPPVVENLPGGYLGVDIFLSFPLSDHECHLARALNKQFSIARSMSVASDESFQHCFPPYCCLRLSNPAAAAHRPEGLCAQRSCLAEFVATSTSGGTRITSRRLPRTNHCCTSGRWESRNSSTSSFRFGGSMYPLAAFGYAATAWRLSCSLCW